MRKIILAVALTATLSGCGAVGRLKAVGKAPKLSEMQPVDMPEIEPSLAMPADRTRTGPSAAVAQQPAGGSASLFRTGAGALFRDQRATRTGDILTIKINIADKADLGNNTSRTRGGSESGGLGGLLGISPVKKLLGADANAAVTTNSGSKYAGGGTTARSETINMTMAAIVTQVLPNGNLVIEGRQEVRVNFEVRDMIVAGIVRPSDIQANNTILSSKIAEARISYGGRGQITDVQQSRYGQQVMDAILPF